MRGQKGRSANLNAILLNVIQFGRQGTLTALLALCLNETKSRFSIVTSVMIKPLSLEVSKMAIKIKPYLSLSCFLFILISLIPLTTHAATPLSCGQVVSTTTISSGEIDNYAFSGTAGDTVRIVAVPVSGNLTYGAVALYDPSGNFITWSNSGPIQTALTVSGVYTLEVYTEFYNGIGTYQVRWDNLNSPCEGEVTLLCGQTAVGTTSSYVQEDYYTFTAAGGDTVRVGAAPVSGSSSFYPGVVLYDPSGTVIATTTGEPIQTALTTTGNYTLRVYGDNYNGDGTYQIRWNNLKNPCGGNILPCGLATSGTITSYVQEDYYTFTASAGDIERIVAAPIPGSSSFYPGVVLYDPSGAVLAGSTNGPIQTALTSTGNYTLIVYADYYEGTGSYNLSEEKLNNPCNSVAMNCGQSLSGSIVNPLDAFFYSFTANAGDALVFTMMTTSGNLTPGLQLFDSSGNIIAENYNLTTGGTVTLNSTVSQAGTYFIAASDYNYNAVGNYTINFQKNGNSCPEVQVLSPNGGDTLYAGSPYLITWTTSASAGLASEGISLSVDSGATYSTIAQGLPGNTTSWQWTPSSTTSNGRIRISVTDNAGLTDFDNSAADFTILSMVTAPASTANVTLSNVSASSNSINTMASQSSSIFFTLNEPATATLMIIPQMQGPTGTPIYQTSQTCAAAGSYAFTWNGTDNTGKVVPDEAYLYVIVASDGTTSTSYSPLASTGTGTGTCSQSSNCDPLSNNPLTVTYSVALSSRVTISITWGAQNFTILNAYPVLPGTYSYVWDVRNPSGEPLDFGALAYCSASLLPGNIIITSGDTPVVSALKTDPFAMNMSYGQFTRIEYTLSRDSNVTIQLVSPSGVAMTLVNNQLQTAGHQEFDWHGMDPTDTTGKEALVSEEGNYMVTIQAVNPITGTSSTTRGNLAIGD